MDLERTEVKQKAIDKERRKQFLNAALMATSGRIVGSGEEGVCTTVGGETASLPFVVSQSQILHGDEA